MNEISQEIKIICQNNIIKGSARAPDSHPWRSWKIRLVAVDHQRERKGKLSHLLDHVEYVLHPTFDNPIRSFSREPYLLQEKGWGEFDMRVILYFKNDWAEPENIFFDLHFREPSYAILHRITFYNPPMPLLGVLALEFAPSDSEPTTGTAKKRRTSPSLAKAKTLYDDTSDYKSVQDTSVSTIVDDVLEEKDVDSIDPIHSAQLDEHTRRAWGVPEHIDMSKLAKRLMTLTSEQTEEVGSILKNHILEENDEKFVVDLYSLGPDLITQLWDITEKKSKSSAALSPFSLVQANTVFLDD